jgi:predicted butyrate kinase (DUF1464 family)
MGKVKKKFKKKVNPEKSNKMIYAVVAGLAILIIVFLAFTISKDTVTDKPELMNSTLKYLQTTPGVLELKTLPEENKVMIIYDRYTENMDFRKIARYAGMKLSHKLGDQELTVLLCEDKEENSVYSVIVKDGRVVDEKILR